MATRVNWYGPQVKGALDKKVAKRLTLAAYVVEGEIKRSMYNEPKTGRMYQKPNTKAWYQASAPGEAPAIRTGMLARSISHKPPFKTGRAQWHCYVGTFGKKSESSGLGTGKMTSWGDTSVPTGLFAGVASRSNTDVSGISGVEGAKYPLYLELGTRYMAPRPYLRRGLDKSKKKIKALFRGTPLRLA